MDNFNINGFQYHYVINAKKGDTVSYGDGTYRVHDDGKGWLHIIIQKNNVRKKISIDKVKEAATEPGSKADYVLNEWWQLYDDYETFASFAAAEINWLAA